MRIPETRYARSGDVSIAYQVLGDGPVDVVYVPGFVSNVETMWEEKRYADFMSRLARSARVIVFDKRGTGVSDRVAGVPDLETRMDDVRAVMEAARSERAVMIGVSEGGPMSALFAATYPERVPALVLYSTFGRGSWAPDNPGSPTLEEWERVAATAHAEWGTLDHARKRASFFGVPSDEQSLMELARRLRSMASPGAAAALYRMNASIDVREVLPAIRVPTLVLSRRDENLELSREVASRIPGARFVELPGTEHIPWLGDHDSLLGEVVAFLATVEPRRSRAGSRSRDCPFHRPRRLDRKGRRDRRRALARTGARAPRARADAARAPPRARDRHRR